MEDTFGKAVLATVPELTFKQSATRLSVAGARAEEPSPIAAVGRAPGGTRGT